MGYSYSGYYGSLPCFRHGFNSRIPLVFGYAGRGTEA